LKKHIIFFAFLISSCAGTTDVLKKEYKQVQSKYFKGDNYYVQFYDGTTLKIDYELWKSTRENSTLVLVKRGTEN
jgi:hypothetical protein